jgi:preprotein translocase subunit YajC
MIDYLPLTLAQAPPADHGVAPSGNAPVTIQSGTATTQPSGGPGGGGGPGGLLGGNSFLLIMLVVLGVFLFMSFNGQRKEKKRRQQLLDNLKKGDKVTTVSGIIGSVVELRDNEVVLKVDENSNTRIKFRKAAIEAVLEEGRPGAGD